MSSIVASRGTISQSITLAPEVSLDIYGSLSKKAFDKVRWQNALPTERYMIVGIALSTERAPGVHDAND